MAKKTIKENINERYVKNARRRAYVLASLRARRCSGKAYCSFIDGFELYAEIEWIDCLWQGTLEALQDVYAWLRNVENSLPAIKAVTGEAG